MMKNLGSSRVRANTRSQAFLLVMLTLFFCVLGFFARGILASFLTPAFARSASGANALSAFFETADERSRDMGALIAENRELKQKLAASETLVLDRNQVYEENISLKAAFGRSAEPNRVLGTVLLTPSATPYDTLMIDVGEDKGIQVGDPVAAGGTALVGKISEVYAHTSRVLLYSSPTESYDGLLRGTIPVKVVGQGGGSLKAEVPYDAKVVEGDTISLPMLQANTAFIVEHVNVGHGDSSSVAYVRLPISPFNLRFVEVWKQ